MSEDSDSLLVAPIAADLRRVVADGTTLTGLRGLELPKIDFGLEQHGWTRSNLPELMTTAISWLDDPVYRAAAEDLFPFPYGEVGWTKLSVRGRNAAERFGISYEGLRKASDGRPSYLDKVLRQVAEQLLAVLEESAEQSQPTGAVSLPVATPSEGRTQGLDAAPLATGRSRRTRFIVAFAGVLVVLVGVFLWSGSRGVTQPKGSRSGAGYLPAGCQLKVGQLDQQLASEPDPSESGARLIDTYRKAANARTIGCPSGAAYRWQSIAVQELSLNEHNSGALLVSPNGVDLYLNNAAWGSYHQLGGKTGDTAQATAGLPVRLVPYGDGHVEIELSAGVVLVAEAADAPYYWIPAVFVSWWRDHQTQTGLPTGNPLATFRQDFQHGFVSVVPPDLAVPVLTVVSRPQEELPTLDTVRGHILRQPDATTWFITADGKRQWIPDGDTWNCLGGEDKRVSRDLPGYAIATLPFGGQAVCPR